MAPSMHTKSSLDLPHGKSVVGLTANAATQQDTDEGERQETIKAIKSSNGKHTGRTNGHQGPVARQRAKASHWQSATAPPPDIPAHIHSSPAKPSADGGIRDQLSNLALLVLLYMMQGIPMGLTLGAMPFMLQSKLSYSQIGTFSLAAYPYSLKLLWSPIVDSLYFPRMGRRKTWIVPIQFCTAFLLLLGSSWISQLYDDAAVNTLTVIFFILVLLAATQDIAVDGWALTLLPAEHVTWAATCQTVGTSAGFFTSFTVFLALQDPNFCNKYVRSWPFLQRLGLAPTSEVPLVTLTGYLRFWGLFFVMVTLFLWLCKPEKELVHSDAKQGDASTPKQGTTPAPAPPSAPSLSTALSSVCDAYTALWGVMRLKAVWGLIALLLTYRLGVLAAESGASLKLLEKGVPKESLAVLVLVQFPVELLSALAAGRWAASHSPGPPFLVSYFLRLLANGATVGLVMAFPPGAALLPLTSTPYLLLAGVSIFSSAVNSLAFTALGSLFNTISDPEMGGAYLTLLNTIANMGHILPKAPMFYLMDSLTHVACMPPHFLDDTQYDATSDTPAWDLLTCPKQVASLTSPSQCVDAGGVCTVVTDGFYVVSWVSLVVGLLFGVVYLKYLPAMMTLPLSAWRASTVLKAKVKQHKE